MFCKLARGKAWTPSWPTFAPASGTFLNLGSGTCQALGVAYGFVSKASLRMSGFNKGSTKVLKGSLMFYGFWGLEWHTGVCRTFEPGVDRFVTTWVSSVRI